MSGNEPRQGEPRQRVLVTGAAGFVGRHLCGQLAHLGFAVDAVTRVSDAHLSSLGAERVLPIADIATVGDWSSILRGVNTVVHLAGRAHVMREPSLDGSALYFHNNVESTRSLFNAAANCGASRFVFMSTVKVFGDGPFPEPLRPSQPPQPTDDYGRSKLEAEQWLLAHDRPGTPEAVIVRPPLVYGPGVRANFLRLMRWVKLGVPLPLARAHNLRSLVSVWNLCDLVIRLIDSPRVVRGVWHVSDGDDCSTTRLIEEIAQQMGKRARLFAAPSWLLEGATSLIGRRAEYERLFGCLQIDVKKTLEDLAWNPPLPVREGLARTVSWYLDQT